MNISHHVVTPETGTLEITRGRHHVSVAVAKGMMTVQATGKWFGGLHVECTPVGYEQVIGAISDGETTYQLTDIRTRAERLGYAIPKGY